MEINERSLNYQEAIVTLSSGQIIEGSINISHHKRISDFINLDKQFITIKRKSGSILFVNKQQILCIEPGSNL